MIDAEHARPGFVPEMISFLQASLSAPAAIFCWVRPDRSLDGAELRGISAGFLSEYLAGVQPHDPLALANLVDRDVRTAMLGEARAWYPADRSRIHADYLGRYGIGDEVDFLFWQDGAPIAALGLFRCRGDAPFATSIVDWRALHRFLEFGLVHDPDLRRQRHADRLRHHYHLTTREIEVATLIEQGCDNPSIAALLRIEVATVKTHVNRIFNKIGIDSRHALAMLRH